MRADERITADVVDQLVWDDRIDASDVDDRLVVSYQM